MPFKNGPPPLHTVWRSMIDRCYNPKMKQYKDYGGRGIKVCPQWRHDYKQFIRDMEPRPLGLTLDRIDNDKDYCPENCKWSTRTEQQMNRRCVRKVVIEGIEYKAWELHKKYGVKADSIIERAEKGMSFSDCVRKERFRDLKPLVLGGQASAAARFRTHCHNGHEFGEDNFILTSNGWRRCKTCGSV